MRLSQLTFFKLARASDRDKNKHPVRHIIIQGKRDKKTLMQSGSGATTTSADHAINLLVVSSTSVSSLAISSTQTSHSLTHSCCLVYWPNTTRYQQLDRQAICVKPSRLVCSSYLSDCLAGCMSDWLTDWLLTWTHDNRSASGHQLLYLMLDVVSIGC